MPLAIDPDQLAGVLGWVDYLEYAEVTETGFGYKVAIMKLYNYNRGASAS